MEELPERDSSLVDITLEEAKDVVGDWVRQRGGYIADNYAVVSRLSIQPNDWNPNQQDDYMYSHQLEVMRQAGQIAPIIVRQRGPDNSDDCGRSEEDHLEIIDGEHRWRAAGDLGWQNISVNNLGEVPDEVARMLTVVMNHVRGESDPLELGKLFQSLREVADGDRKKLDRMTAWMPFREREIDTLVEAVRKDTREAKLPRKVETGTNIVSFTFKLPTDAAAVCTRALESVVAVAQCSTDRAFELICADYLAGLSEEERRMVDSVTEMEEIES